jgi:Na+/proline symporter
VIFGSLGVVIYATAGGIKSCIWADFFQYSIAMFGAVYAAVVACRQPEVAGLAGLLQHPAVVEKLSWMPDFSNWLAWVPLLLLPVAVQWWAVWYPGAEPGGGGYIAQRMLAAKDEKNAIGATLFFNFMHYAMRPWPWIVVALASLVCYPTLESIRSQFPGIDPVYLREDIAYPVMIAKLGPGLLGLVVASLIAAYMSTIGTHLNWGSSYAVNDFYQRFLRKHAGQKELVTVGRLCTVLLMVLAGFFALTFLQSANQAFEILLLSGAGTGAIYLLRWFWWRINAWTEIVAMVVATVAACWIVLGVGSDGTLAWYIGRPVVADRVFTIDDPSTVAAVVKQRQSAATEIAQAETELDVLAQAWRTARKESDAARDRARTAYDTQLQQLNQLEARTSVPAFVDALGDRPWQSGIRRFYQEQQRGQLERDNPRRSRAGLAPKSLAEVQVSFGGLVSGDKIYIYHPEVAGLTFGVQLLVCVAFVTLSWVITTWVTPPADQATLRRFYKLCHPGGPGWRKVVEAARRDGEEIDRHNAIDAWKLPIQLLCVFLGCVAVYAALFAVGNFVYGNRAWGIALCVVSLGAVVLLFRSFHKLGVEST